MKSIKITSDQLHCPTCGTVIPKGQTKCPNPKCPTKKPLHDKAKITITEMELVEA
jgi:predicted nucleic acid-binding Zn ribbon protein